MLVNICAATFRTADRGPFHPALAVISAVELNDVIAFIEFENGIPKVYEGTVWDYQLAFSAPVTVQYGTVTFGFKAETKG